VFAALSLAACNLGQSRQTGSRSSPAGDRGTSGGSCKNVAICTVIPLAQVNSATNKMLTSSSSTSSGTGPNSGDTCDYNGTGPRGGFVELIRFCNDPASNAGVAYDTDRNGYLAPMGTRVDVANVGEKAFYRSEPTGSGLPTAKVMFEAVKGPVLVTFRASNVAPADDAMVKQGLASFANTLLKQ
jgi:hypothetical protein